MSAYVDEFTVDTVWHTVLRYQIWHDKPSPGGEDSGGGEGARDSHALYEGSSLVYEYFSAKYWFNCLRGVIIHKLVDDG